MIPFIPPELWDEIIDHLRDDKSTLCKCGLVCRFWLWSSRSYLFSTIVLSPSDNDTTLAALLSPGSTIPPHMRALEIIEGAWNRYSMVNTMVPKLPQLSALERLSISWVTWDYLTHEARERLCALLHGLKSLTLEFMAFTTLGQALQFISSAPSLESLSLDNANSYTDWGILLNKFSAPPIKHIVFRRSRYIHVIMDWLFHWQPTPSVRNLSFDGIGDPKMPSMSAYIRRLGPTLEYLELACSDTGETQDTLCKELNLTQNTSLKAISIDYINLSTFPTGLRTFNWIIDILSQITSRVIERVTLLLVLDTPQDLVRLNLPALAAFFAHGSATVSERSRLQFGISGTKFKTEIRAAIAESLHELDSQGRLEFGGCPMATSL